MSDRRATIQSWSPYAWRMLDGAVWLVQPLLLGRARLLRLSDCRWFTEGDAW